MSVPGEHAAVGDGNVRLALNPNSRVCGGGGHASLELRDVLTENAAGPAVVQVAVDVVGLVGIAGGRVVHLAAGQECAKTDTRPARD